MTVKIELDPTGSREFPLAPLLPKMENLVSSKFWNCEFDQDFRPFDAGIFQETLQFSINPDWDYEVDFESSEDRVALVIKRKEKTK